MMFLPAGNDPRFHIGIEFLLFTGMKIHTSSISNRIKTAIVNHAHIAISHSVVKAEHKQFLFTVNDKRYYTVRGNTQCVEKSEHRESAGLP